MRWASVKRWSLGSCKASAAMVSSDFMNPLYRRRAPLASRRSPSTWRRARRDSSPLGDLNLGPGPSLPLSSAPGGGALKHIPRSGSWAGVFDA
jgi:hypothetical protein